MSIFVMPSSEPVQTCFDIFFDCVCILSWWNIRNSHNPHHFPSAISASSHITSRKHCNAVIMSAIGSQITSLTIVYSDADQRKHQSSASLAFVRGIHRRPVNSPHKGPVTPKMFPFDDVIMGKMGWPRYCFSVGDLVHILHLLNEMYEN